MEKRDLLSLEKYCVKRAIVETAYFCNFVNQFTQALSHVLFTFKASVAKCAIYAIEESLVSFHSMQFHADTYLPHKIAHLATLALNVKVIFSKTVQLCKKLKF